MGYSNTVALQRLRFSVVMSSLPHRAAPSGGVAIQACQTHQSGPPCRYFTIHYTARYIAWIAVSVILLR